jgi:hypothetical protein
MAKTNTIDYRDGGLEAFNRMLIYVKGGKLTLAEIEYEMKAWNEAQYEAATKQQIDLSISRQEAAQQREIRKEMEAILVLKQKLLDADLNYHKQMSDIYNPQTPKVNTVQYDENFMPMKSDAFDNQHMAGNFRNGF